MLRQGNDDAMNENVEIRFSRLARAPAYKPVARLLLLQ
jgi:hypothetical protein